jgi:CheY-like chemotaxis protein
MSEIWIYRQPAAYDSNVQAKAQVRHRILLVDSDTRFLRQCSEMLSKQGYEVLTETDGFASMTSRRCQGLA